ncbi:probable ATP-dependent RNA helicase DDX52 [Branchiostoma floridae]|uniref:Probable ATP-dependent RNA helicase DDX52 n=1 Tax=Branchiostoma floridae TaxID=7739 RepID=A0A9J7N685_BRAFL|nr:probable ATP-dependent RNA helicase DDX52 [Branchiostoma floridae]
MAAPEELQLFRKLGIGAKFDTKRFRKDAERSQMIRAQVTPTVSKEEADKALDFFGNLSKQKPSKPAAESTGDNVARTSAETSSKNNCSEVLKSDGLRVQSKKGKKRKQKGELADSDDSDYSEDSLQLLGDIKASEKKKKKRKKKDLTVNKVEQIKQEKLSEFRRKNRIHVQGSDIPAPVTSFQELQGVYGIHPQILTNLQGLGYEEPTPIQMQAIPLMLQRREILACAPTGSGKTAAFILPILHHLREPRRQGFRAVVVSPTRELAKQTFTWFQRLGEGRGFRTYYIEKPAQAAKKFGPNSAKKFDILVTTPNRLVYMLKQDPPIVSLHSVEWLVVDESDKLFEEGKQGFRDQLGVIYQACDSSHVRRAMFSATFAYDVEQWCKVNLDNVVTVSIGARNSAVDTVEQQLLFVGSESGKLLAMRELVRKGLTPPVLIFVQSKERAKELFHELIYDGINVDVIHADRTQTQRDNTVKCFRTGKIWVLICTELMGRGIDFKGVNLVINYDFPTSAVSYIHRIGRTGRAGRPGKALTFFTEDDIVHLRSIANVMREAGCEVPEYMLELKKANRKERRFLEKRAPKRKSISTTPKMFVDKAMKKRKMIEKSKKMQGKTRKHEAVQSDSSTANADDRNTVTESGGNRKNNEQETGKHKGEKLQGKKCATSIDRSAKLLSVNTNGKGPRKRMKKRKGANQNVAKS